MPNSETGHAKNVGNFEALIAVCVGFGAKYNPVSALITILSLNSLLTLAANALDALKNAELPFKNALTARNAAFSPLSKLVTRVKAALNSSDVPEQIVSNAETYIHKIKGERSSSKEDPPPTNPETPATDSSKNISVSQMSFDLRTDNMNSLVTLLSGQPNYKPNETDLTVESLTAVLTDMKTTNKAVKDLTPAVNNARIERDRVLYTKTTGLVDVAQKVKDYVKSVYGAGSPQYKQVSKLKFTSKN